VRVAAAPNSTSENAPSREVAAAKNEPLASLVAQDEVRVQWDRPTADYIEIYKFVNQQSGSSIL
jgi:hypothetical protein